MKISFVDDEPEIFPIQYGGKARTITTLAKNFSLQKNIENVRILSRSINDRRKNFRYKGVDFVKLEGYEMIGEIIAEAKNSDILNVHTSSFTFPYLPERKAKIINHLHDVIFATSDTGSHLDKAIGGDWDAIISPSEFASRTLKNTAPWKAHKTPIYTIPRAIDGKTFKKVQREKAFKKVKELKPSLPDFSHKYPIIFFPHRVNAGKGEILLPQIYKLLQKKYKDCLIITTFEDSDNHRNKNILNLGWIKTDDIKYFYSISDITISLSFLPESFSQVCLESLSCGTPVICLKFGNLASFSSEFSAIYSCRPESEDIFLKITDILSNPQKTKATVLESKKILNKKYAPGVIISKYLSVYNEILSGNKPEITCINNKIKYFTSPLIADHDNNIYLKKDTEIKKYEINEIQSKILKCCLNAKCIEEIHTETKINKEKIDKTLKYLISEKIIYKSLL